MRQDYWLNPITRWQNKCMESQRCITACMVPIKVFSMHTTRGAGVVGSKYRQVIKRVDVPSLRLTKLKGGSMPYYCHKHNHSSAGVNCDKCNAEVHRARTDGEMMKEQSHIISRESLSNGTLRLYCSCGKEILCHRWMSVDQWNDTLQEFKNQHSETKEPKP